jgi:ABC-type glutathione transport system ATPase component
METDSQPLISIKDLTVHFPLAGGSLFRRSRQVVKAVDGVTLDISPGETLGLVGESGCGKSTLGRAILRLTEPTAGQILFRGDDLAQLSKSAMREQRRHLQIIFQDPYASMNPRMTSSQIMGEPSGTFQLAKGRAR